MHDAWAWEGVARDVLESTGCDDMPVDALELAWCCDLQLRWGRVCGARLDGRTIYVSRRLEGADMQAAVAHEVAHWALRRAGELDTEEAAWHVAGALLVPWSALQRPDALIATKAPVWMRMRRRAFQAAVAA